MAKRSNRSRGRRVVTTNAKRSLPTPNYQFHLEDYLSPSLDDRRHFHPDRDRHAHFDTTPAMTVDLVPARLVPAPVKPKFKGRVVSSPYDLPDAVAFKASDRVITCVRRTRRKEVLHALKKTGKRGQKAPRRSAFSDIHC